MDCAKSIELLSDFRDGWLDQEEQEQVRVHLITCTPCVQVYRDLDTIVITAKVFCTEQEIVFPDETALWERMGLAKNSNF